MICAMKEETVRLKLTANAAARLGLAPLALGLLLVPLLEPLLPQPMASPIIPTSTTRSTATTM